MRLIKKILIYPNGIPEGLRGKEDLPQADGVSGRTGRRRK
jgi:hypothetical protein